MVVGKIAVADCLCDEWPQEEGFVGGFEVEYDVEGADEIFFSDEEYAPEEFFGD